MPPAFCRNQNRVMRPNTTDPSRGCFLLSHDRPTATRTNYNTTGDLLALLADDTLARWFRGPVRMYIALCFKWDAAIEGVCDNTADASLWRAAVDVFFAEAGAHILQHGLNVELVLDGVATPSSGRQCLRNRWPWNATWITGQDPAAAMFSDNVAQGFGTYQVNNMPAGTPAGSHLREEQRVRYGKFAAGRYPFLLYEPADQASIRQVVEQYEQQLPLHGPGFRFAINIDPVQLQLYAAGSDDSLTDATSRVVVQDDGDNIRPLLADPYVLLAPSSGGDGPARGGLRYITLATAKPPPKGPTLERRRRPSTLPCVLTTDTPEITGWGRASPTILYASQDGGIVSWVADDGGPAADGCTLRWTGATTVLAPALASSVAAWVDGSEPGDQVRLVQAYVPTSNATAAPASVVCFATFTVNGTAGSMSKASVATLLQANRSCVELPQGQSAGTSEPTDTAAVAGAVSTIDVSVAWGQAGMEACGGNPDARGVGIAVVGTTAGDVLRIEFCLTGAGVVHLLRPQPVFTSVGSNPHAAITMTDNGTALVAMVQGDSYCWNSERHNKQPEPATCDATPTATPFVLTYTVAAWDALLRLPGPVSACTWPATVHGAYGQGRMPTVAFRAGAVLAVRAAPPANATVGPETVACGCPAPLAESSSAATAAGTVVMVDEWPLPDL